MGQSPAVCTQRDGGFGQRTQYGESNLIMPTQIHGAKHVTQVQRLVVSR